MAKKTKAKQAPVKTLKAPEPAKKAGPSALQGLSHSIQLGYNEYVSGLKQNQKLRLIDTFLGFLLVLGIVQFVFCVLVGTYPFNAFLGGFIATVGQFVLTVSLRLQSVQANQPLFSKVIPERAFGDYIFASLLLHFVVIHFIN